jgi:hypothetical protein
MSGHFTSVERIGGVKLRCTGATWSDAVVIFPGEVLTFQNIERQAHALRAPAPGGCGTDPPPAPRLGEDDFDGIDGGKLRRDLGRCRSGLSPTRVGSAPPIW